MMIQVFLIKFFQKRKDDYSTTYSNMVCSFPKRESPSTVGINAVRHELRHQRVRELRV